MKNNICVTGLLSKYTENIAKQLSQALETNFANLISMVEFDIVDISNTINVCGLDYYKDIVAKKLKELATFENTTIFANYYLLQYDNCKSIFRNKLLTIYIDAGEKYYDNRLKEENLSELEAKLEKGTYKVRNKFFSKQCDIIVRTKDKSDKEIVEMIIKQVFKFYSKEVKNNENRRKNS